jgi:pimeloyl-ACP methyl ester carboxylesterase
MTSHKRFTRRYWFKLIRFFILVLVIVILLLWHGAAVIQGRVYTHPARSASTSTPADRGMEYEEMTLISRDGTHLGAWYIPGSNHAGIMLLHGLGGNRAAMLDHADYLHAAGYHVLIMGARGHDTSDGNVFEWGGQGPIDDVLAGVAYLQSQPAIEKIGVMGFSMGGMQALGAAAQSDEIDAVIADGAAAAVYSDFPHHHWPDMIYTVYDAIMFGAMNYYTEGEANEFPTRDNIARIAPRPLLMIAGGKGSWNEADLIEWWYDDMAGDNAEFWRIPDAGHTEGLQKHPDEYIARVTEFFNTALLAAESP